jgi:hypothetical protein
VTDLATLSPTAAEWWGVAEAASHCGILPGTWRDYVARGRAPQPDDPDEGAPPQRRRPRWRAETVTAWQASRPRAPRRRGGHEMTPLPSCALWRRLDRVRATARPRNALSLRCGSGVPSMVTAPAHRSACSSMAEWVRDRVLDKNVIRSARCTARRAVTPQLSPRTARRTDDAAADR